LFPDILDELLLDRTVRIVVLQGEGKNFSAGLDFDDANRAGPLDHSTIFFNQRKYSLISVKLRNIPQPVISLMKGKMVGSGLAYALSADVRFGDPSLEISSGANRMGLTGADIGLGWLLPRLCGWSATSEILLSFRWIGAERLLRTGLISDIVPADKLEEAGRKMSKDMLEMSHMGLIATKMQINLGKRSRKFLGLNTDPLLQCKTESHSEPASRRKTPTRFLLVRILRRLLSTQGFGKMYKRGGCRARFEFLTRGVFGVDISTDIEEKCLSVRLSSNFLKPPSILFMIASPVQPNARSTPCLRSRR
jgi:enoyl-CoA hydratase